MSNSEFANKKLLPLFIPIFLETFFLMLAGMAIDEVMRAGFMIIRYRSGKWEKKILLKTNKAMETPSQGDEA